jgi:hypothetical protein
MWWWKSLSVKYDILLDLDLTDEKNLLHLIPDCILVVAIFRECSIKRSLNIDDTFSSSFYGDSLFSLLYVFII